jgi:hypothetical protein
MTYRCTARNKSSTTMAAAGLALVPSLDTAVPVDKWSLVFSSAAAASDGVANAHVSIAYTGALVAGVVDDLTNLWTAQLSKGTNTPWVADAVVVS